jgi:hypothetical protein
VDEPQFVAYQQRKLQASVYSIRFIMSVWLAGWLSVSPLVTGEQRNGFSWKFITRSSTNVRQIILIFIIIEQK